MSNQIEDTCTRCKCYTCGEEYPQPPDRCGCGNDGVKGWYDKLTFHIQVFINPETAEDIPAHTEMKVVDCHESLREYEHDLKKKYPHPQYEVVCDDVTDKEAQP